MMPGQLPVQQASSAGALKGREVAGRPASLCLVVLRECHMVTAR